MRRLIFCFDGSWNSLSLQKEPTNVVLVAESILPVSSKGIDQIVYYDEGVGTSSDETWRGGIFGKGLELNIREAYRFLIFNYLVGDEIFVFGFSRGGFTALSFIGFIRCVGVLAVNDARQIDEAWSLYMKHANREGEDPDELRSFRGKYCKNLCIDQPEIDWRLENVPSFDASSVQTLSIKYVGVWDVVGSIGFDVVKSTFIRKGVKSYRHHDTNLSSTVQTGRHAVSIDERRVHFVPTIWGNVKELNAARNKPHDDLDAPYQQKWFPGDHGSVGGGGLERGLSNAALHWIVRGARSCGLEINLGERSQLKSIRYNQRAPLHNSAPGGFAKRVFGQIKSAVLSLDRVGPEEAHDVSPAALRRWFTPPSDLPEEAEYRPAPLRKLAKKIELRRPEFVQTEFKSITEYVNEYTVVSGDTLSDISKSLLGDAERYNDIFAANRDRIDHPDDIFPGDIIRIPLT